MKSSQPMSPATPGAQSLFRPLSPVCGADCGSLDLSRPLADETLAAIMQAFRQNHVLVFRDQAVEDRHLADFALKFGEVEQHYIQKADGQLMEAVHTITNFDAAGKPSTRPFINSNYYWHSDKSYLALPSLMTMLYAVELPPDGGGDTQFADMTAAHAALPEATRRAIDGLRVVQSLEYMRSSLGDRPPTEAEKRKAPPVEQPLVRRHPETGEKSLYIGMYSSHIVGMDEAAGRALLKELEAHATEPRFVYTHRWQANDVVLWDNRCLMHRAVANYAMDKHRRVLKRVCVRGTDRPH
jgi:alpha-ketoglutarate-dependent taurine dioxygenase